MKKFDCSDPVFFVILEEKKITEPSKIPYKETINRRLKRRQEIRRDQMSNLYEEVNPVYNTAKTTLHQLVQAGVAEAAEFEKALLELEPEKGAFSADERVFSEGPLEDLNKLMLELRYHMANREIALAGGRNVLDLACGYTPRGRYLLDKGYRYVGGDLPAVAEVMDRLNEKLMNGRGTYLPVDVTNSSSVLAAADEMDGPVTVTSEGVMVYLTLPEKKAMWRSIRDVLVRHGGVWITTDFEVGVSFKVVASALLGDRFMDALRKNKKEFDRQSDASTRSLPLDEAERLLKEEGLVVEKHPFWSPDLHLTQVDAYPEETREKLIAGLKTVYIWVIRLDEGVKAEPRKTTMDGLEISHAIADGHLHLALRGRLDSISAPRLLELFQNMIDDQEIRRITVSAGELAYISSAGLRVILRMTKHVGQGNLTMEQPTELVLSILEQTGFSDVLGL